MSKSQNNNNRRRRVPKNAPRPAKTNSSQMSAPVAISSKQRFSEKKTQHSREIKHSELIGTVNGSVNFNINKSYAVNPGLSSTFPWLAQTASQWQQYTIDLVVRYVSRCSTMTPGSVIISPDYNVIDSRPEDEQNASNTQNAVSDSAWKSMSCRLDRKAMFPMGGRKIIRLGPLMYSDYSTYDACRINICTSGQLDNSPVGQIWLDYSVTLFVPQTSTGFISRTYTNGYYNASAVVLNTANPVSGLAFIPFSYLPNTVDHNGFGAASAALPYQFQPAKGTYFLTFYAQFEYDFIGDTGSTYQLGIVMTVNNNLVGLSYSLESTSNVNQGRGVIETTFSNIITFNGDDLFGIEFSVGSTSTGKLFVIPANSSRLFVSPA